MKKALRVLLTPIAAALLLASASASATVLTGNMSVDNGYRIYLSTADNVQGTLFGSGNNWEATYSNSVGLSAGTSYFLHVYAYDQGGIGGFLGDFSLSGSTHAFSNGMSTLTTNTTNWMGNTTGFSGAYSAVESLGTDGVSPWGNRYNISDSATWIWSGNADLNNHAYFTTQINAAVSNDVPEPATAALLGLGLFGVGIARRRAAKVKQA